MNKQRTLRIILGIELVVGLVAACTVQADIKSTPATTAEHAKAAALLEHDEHIKEVMSHVKIECINGVEYYVTEFSTGYPVPFTYHVIGSAVIDSGDLGRLYPKRC